MKMFLSIVILFLTAISQSDAALIDEILGISIQDSSGQDSKTSNKFQFVYNMGESKYHWDAILVKQGNTSEFSHRAISTSFPTDILIEFFRSNCSWSLGVTNREYSFYFATGIGDQNMALFERLVANRSFEITASRVFINSGGNLYPQIEVTFTIGDRVLDSELSSAKYVLIRPHSPVWSSKVRGDNFADTMRIVLKKISALQEEEFGFDSFFESFDRGISIQSGTEKGSVIGKRVVRDEDDSEESEKTSIGNSSIRNETEKE